MCAIVLQAVIHLQQQPSGTFIISDDLANDQKLILSYVSQGQVKHAEIDNAKVASFIQCGNMY